MLLTVKEHVIAHWRPWKVLGKSQDLSAFLFRIGDTEKALELRRQAILDARERDKINKQGFFNSDFQREMGSRGGSVGGSKNTERQYLARQRVGLTHGRQTGLGNQGNGLGQFVSSFSIWAYSAKVASKPRGASRTDEQMYLVSPKQAFVDITKTLNTFVPGSVRTPSAMHKVVYGERAQMYGWRIVNTLTRSEIREGILNFMQNNPTVVLQFEEDLTVIEGFE
uniref:Putative HNH homing endonuclease n=1 Tax=Chlamydomonas applanata TaxID=35704 RepID=A0A0S2LPB4_CHLAP|nr:putative HNH homing endonuclease [Chlamydomonas applanata]ALO63251.1 putative HNH homing endonuclease [Chlamydomonas applanata]